MFAQLLTTSSYSSNQMSFYDDVADLCRHLRDHFCVRSGDSIQQLKTIIGDCEQFKGKFVGSYFCRLTKLWVDLAQYVTLLSCIYSGCKCKIGEQFTRLQEEDRMHRFLMGLDTEYASFQSNLLNQDPLPSLTRAYQKVHQEERLKALLPLPVERDVLAFKVNLDG